MTLSLTRRTLHVVAIWTIAVVQPVLDLLGSNAEFFVARSHSGSDILLMTAALILIPALILGVIEFVAERFGRQVGWITHLVLLFLLATLTFTPILAGALGGSSFAIVLGAVAGFVATSLYAKHEAAQFTVSILSVAPAVVAVYFLIVSPASSIVFSQEADVDGSSLAKNPIPVVFVVFDEFPTATLSTAAGTIDDERFPTFAKFAEDATWYRNATTEFQSTLQSIPAMLSGLKPDGDELPILAHHPKNLFTLLQNSHDFNVVEPLTSLCPPELCDKDQSPLLPRMGHLFSDLSIVSAHLLLPQQLARTFPPIDQAWDGFGGDGDDEKPAGGDEGLGAFFSRDFGADFAEFVVGTSGSETGQPQFSFIHSGLPHAPWIRNSAGQVYAPDRGYIPGVENEVWSDDEIPPINGLSRHAMQASYADTLLSQLLEQLKASGTYDESLIIVTADHGVSFRQSLSRREATEETIGAIAGVPLFVKFPNQRRGQIEARYVETLDIAPTVASALGISGAGEFDGVPLDSDHPGREQTVISKDGAPFVEVSNSEFLVSLRSAIHSKEAVLSTLPGAASFLPVGNHPDYLGMTVTEASSGPATTAVQLTTGTSQIIDPKASYLPLEVSGEVDDDAGRVDLLIALNGRIVSGTSTFEEDGAWVFSSVLPWDRLNRGRNRVSVLVVDDVGRARVAATETFGSIYSRDSSGGLSREGHKLEQQAFLGYVDLAAENSGAVQLAGWAVAEETYAPADSVVVVAGDREVGRTSVTEDRPDVVDAYEGNDAMLRSGFRLSIPASDLPCPDPEAGLHVYAVTNDHAGELGLVESAGTSLKQICQR